MSLEIVVQVEENQDGYETTGHLIYLDEFSLCHLRPFLGDLWRFFLDSLEQDQAKVLSGKQLEDLCNILTTEVKRLEKLEKDSLIEIFYCLRGKKQYFKIPSEMLNVSLSNLLEVADRTLGLNQMLSRHLSETGNKSIGLYKGLRFQFC